MLSMDNSFTLDTQVLATDVDLCGRCSPYAVFSLMQQLADMHASRLGLGRFALLEKGLVWVVARARLEMLRYPGAYEPITAATFYGAPTRIGFHRYYSFQTRDGEPLGKASNLWLLVDAHSHRIVPPGRAEMAFPEEDAPAELRLDTTKLRFEGEATSTTMRTPVYSDYDVNGHVNNARYIQWVCDALPLHLLKENELAALDINYIAEVGQGEEVELGLAQQEGGFMLQGSAQGEARFIARGSLRPTTA